MKFNPSPILYQMYTSIFLLCLSVSVNAQEILHWDEYFNIIHKADTLYQAKHFSESANMYSSAFLFNKGRYSEGDKYKAACAWAKAGQPDSALTNLKREIHGGFYNYKALVNETAFKSLQHRKEWNTIVNEVKANQIAKNKKLGDLITVKPKLENILLLDQKYRLAYNKQQELAADGKGLKEILLQMQLADAKNIKYVSQILDKYGWIDYKIIGLDANAALFLVVQHADSANQEKYLPLLKQAVKDNKAMGNDLALLEDRVLIRRGQKQVYGSQVDCDSTGKNCRVLPIEDEKNVDKRRAEVGLQPLAEYLKYWNIIYKQPG